MPRSTADLDAFEIVLPKDPTWVAAVRLTTSAVGHRLGISIESIDDLKIIVAEACSYCIHSGGGGRLHVAFVPQDHVLTIRVDDPQFARPAGHTTENPGEVFDSEAGLFIIKSLADHVDYEYVAGRGLTLTVRKSLRQ